MIPSTKSKPLPPEAVPKIGKFIRLLASDQPGEVLGARDALRRTLSAFGLDLNDLADGLEATVTHSECTPDWLHMTGWLRANAYRLSNKEGVFIGNMARLVDGGLRPTERQAEWIEDLYRREIQRAAA